MYQEEQTTARLPLFHAFRFFEQNLVTEWCSLSLLRGNPDESQALFQPVTGHNSMPT